jgi:uncharacterized membrane protein YuzA (DUF378 family)
MFKNMEYMKGIDIIVATLLVIGGLNWGLVGIFGFNLVATIFGEMSIASRIVYFVVGFCALYQVFTWRIIQRRWECSSFFKPAEGAAS